jgi:Protein of unknown function (DUF1573)
MKLSLPVCLFVLSLIISPALFGQPVSTPPVAATNVSGPQITFASTVFDFGKVTVGGAVKHEFIFTNTGDALLVVSSVKPGCGCTTAGDWTKEVEPGKTGIIPLQFNSNPHSVGGVTKNIMVTSNGKDHPVITLQLQGIVWSPLQVSPPNAYFDIAADSSGSAESTVRILNNTDQPITLTGLKNNNTNQFSAELKEVQPGKEFNLIIKTVPPLSPGQIQAFITIQTSSTVLPSISVFAIARISAPLSVTPSQITLPPGPLDNAVTNFITIQNNSTNPVTLSELSVDDKRLDVQLKETQPGRQFSVTLIAPAGFQIESGGKTKLTIQTSNPKMTSIPVSIMQAARPVVPKPAGQ